MSKILNIYGKDKTVEFVEVNQNSGVVKIFFDDKTFVMVEGVEIIKRG